MNTRLAHHPIARDFGLKTRRARGYCLDNNGEHQVRTRTEVEGLV